MYKLFAVKFASFFNPVNDAIFNHVNLKLWLLSLQ